MSFVLRAALVIGALSYFAAQRHGGAGPAGEFKALAERPAAQLTALVGSLPPELREGATQAVAAELVRQLAPDPASSRDTLSAGDRRPAWRGTDGH